MANMINIHFVIISMPVNMSKLSTRSQIVCEIQDLDYAFSQTHRYCVCVFTRFPPVALRGTFKRNC